MSSAVKMLLRICWLLWSIIAVSGMWVPMNTSTVPNRYHRNFFFPDGRFHVRCHSDELAWCKIAFSALPSALGTFAVAFHPGCPRANVVVMKFNDVELIVSLIDLKKDNVVLVRMNGRVELDDNLYTNMRGQIALYPDQIVKIYADVPIDCSFILTNGTAVVSVADPVTTTVPVTKSNSTGPPPTAATRVVTQGQREEGHEPKAALSAHAVWGIALAIIITLFVTMGIIVWFYKFKEKSTKMSVVDDNSPRRVIRNKRLKYLLKSGKDYMTEECDGKSYWHLISAEDMRTKYDDYDAIIYCAESFNKCTSVKPAYYAADWTKMLSAEQESKKIRTNKKNFTLMGPPRIKSRTVNDVICCDHIDEYLRNIRVISADEFSRMKTAMGGNFRRVFTEAELNFFSADISDSLKYWKLLMKDRKHHLKKYGHLKNDLAALAKHNLSSEASTFHNLCWFYELFGDYIDRIPLKAHLFSRLPLQGLMLLLFRSDLTEDVEKRILLWFKVTSFGLMRRKDYGASSEVLAYPMLYMIKLWYPHDFSKVSGEDMEEIRTTLDAAEPPPEQDWEFV